ncbi:hydroxymethylglutaryl-CoA lyase [Rhodothalassium salexigens]|uniref:hydroxymethylglutaryl-CoA lyase n=1 Tax=Rhodothalassium salexigens TaxID=1086 RepID=UPI0019088D90|nr:hydroxymethylglutaryl-CoA lyase [Rhodothalassium salexigens]MBK1639251.1 hydroxymethylglutaryl-CoA lyase [Rhodothalassium salexigens DSM 2132]
MTAAPRAVEIVEVGARDGLQNEATPIDTAHKLALIARLMAAGARRLEVASFVHPRLVPQMADAEAVVAGLPADASATYVGLVLNKRGLLRALETRAGGRRGVDEIGCVAVASDGFGNANQGMGWQASVETVKDLHRLAHAEGLAAQVTVSVCWGDPFDGPVAPDRVVEICRRLAEAGPREIALADTIGVAVPARVTELFHRVAEAVPDIPLRGHFHDTRNTGIANAWAAYEAGASVLDASLGGLGGCPFAPRATGNIATEDLVYLLDRSGVGHGLDLAALIDTAGWMAEVMAKPLPGRVARAGGFPA